MKSIRLFLITTLMVIVGALPSHATFFRPASDGKPIVIVYLPNELGDAPRGPVFNPFSAYQQNSQITLESSAPMGSVSVNLVSTAGDYYTVAFDTEEGSLDIPISGNSGDYTLLLTTQSGIQFIGEFTI